MTDIQKIAYEKYTLQWMLNNGYALTDLVDELNEAILHIKGNMNLKAVFNDWKYNNGFNGELWACFDEFYYNEYQDECYMKTLLSDDEWEKYLEDKKVCNE